MNMKREQSSHASGAVSSGAVPSDLIETIRRAVALLEFKPGALAIYEDAMRALDRIHQGQGASPGSLTVEALLTKIDADVDLYERHPQWHCSGETALRVLRDFIESNPETPNTPAAGGDPQGDNGEAVAVEEAEELCERGNPRSAHQLDSRGLGRYFQPHCSCGQFDSDGGGADPAPETLEGENRAPGG